VRDFDTNVRALAEKIRRLAFDAEQYELSLKIAIAAGHAARVEDEAIARG
jgi:hypothetical protein